MIEWGNFLVVLLVSVIGGCGVMLLFSLGLRFAGPDTNGRRRSLGVLLFVLCGLLIAYGVYLVIPFFHQ